MASICIVPGSVSHGTLRPEDVIHASLTELLKIAPEKHDEIVADPDYQNVLWQCKEFDSVGGCEETAHYLIDEVQDALNGLAPEGYYFGAHPKDSSDLGWWQHKTKVTEVILYNSTTPQGEFSVHASAFTVYYHWDTDEYELVDRTSRQVCVTMYGTIQDVMLEIGTILNNNTAITGTVESLMIEVED